MSNKMALDARNELVTAIHTLASHFENTLYALRDDAEALAKAKGDIAHAMKIAAKHNANGAAIAALQVSTAREVQPEKGESLGNSIAPAAGNLVTAMEEAIASIDAGMHQGASDTLGEALWKNRAAIAALQAEPPKLDSQIHDSSTTHVHATVEAACWGEYTIEASRDDESRNWYITVTAPSGIRDYDGYWRDSDFKTVDEVINQAIAGACLMPLPATPPKD